MSRRSPSYPQTGGLASSTRTRSCARVAAGSPRLLGCCEGRGDRPCGCRDGTAHRRRTTQFCVPPSWHRCVAGGGNAHQGVGAFEVYRASGLWRSCAGRVCVVRSLYGLSTWTRAVRLVAGHAALQVVLGAAPSAHAVYRFTKKLRRHWLLLRVVGLTCPPEAGLPSV